MSDPATPISMVTMIPPGSLPGITNFATAPTTKPIKSSHIRCIASPCRRISGGRPLLSAAVGVDFGPKTTGLSQNQSQPRRTRVSAPHRRKWLRCCWNDQFLTDFNLVGIFQVVGFGDDRILIGITVKVPADFGKVVSRLHGIALVTL